MGKTVAMTAAPLRCSVPLRKVSECLPLPRAHPTPAEKARPRACQSADGARHEREHARRANKDLVHTAAASNPVRCSTDMHQDASASSTRRSRSRRRSCARSARKKYIVASTTANLHGLDQCAGRNRRDAGIRPIGGGKLAGRSCLHGDIGQQDRQGLQPVRIERHKPRLYLWQPRPAPGRAEPAFAWPWGGGGCCLFRSAKIGSAEGAKSLARGVAELKTTFARPITPRWWSLQEALQHRICRLRQSAPQARNI